MGLFSGIGSGFEIVGKGGTMMKQVRRDKGITLIEVLLATVVLVLGFLIIVSSFIAMAKSDRYSEKQDKAIQLANRVMEDMRNRTFAQIQCETGTFGEYPNFPDYRHEVVVNTVGRVKKVTVNIYFDKNHRKISLDTFFANM
jgi:Tfp pilus assembly protein PilV